MAAMLRFALILVVALTATAAHAQTVVPPGNLSAVQPEIPAGSASRTRAARTTYEAKYQRVMAFLRADETLRARIVEVAGRYGIDPVHIAGAIVGEHTYNVDVYDRLQTYYVKAVAYLDAGLTFAHGGQSVEDLVARPEFGACDRSEGSYRLWVCRETVWNEAFRGRTVDGRTYPDNRFSAVFFQPLYAGQTFGIGQLNPLTALQMSDKVHEVSGLPKLDHRDARQVYRTIMDPDLTLAYVAALIRTSIDAYRTIAGFDISPNPGITATLYNVGDPEARARTLKAENDQRRREGRKARLPRENYYGWLVNERLDELKALF